MIILCIKASNNAWMICFIVIRILEQGSISFDNCKTPILRAYQLEPEMKLVQVQDFEKLLAESWHANYSDWPNRNYFLPSSFLRSSNENPGGEQTVNDNFTAISYLQKEQELKRQVYQDLQQRSQDQDYNMQIFVIYNFVINAELASSLEYKMRQGLTIPKDIKIDFSIFTNSGHIILIKFASQSMLSCDI